MQAEVARPVVVSEPSVVEAVIITVQRQQLTRVGEWTAGRGTREREKEREEEGKHRVTESPRGLSRV